MVIPLICYFYDRWRVQSLRLNKDEIQISQGSPGHRVKIFLSFPDLMHFYCKALYTHSRKLWLIPPTALSVLLMQTIISNKKDACHLLQLSCLVVNTGATIFVLCLVPYLTPTLSIGLIAVRIKSLTDLTVTWATNRISPPASGTRQINSTKEVWGDKRNLSKFFKNMEKCFLSSYTRTMEVQLDLV